MTTTTFPIHLPLVGLNPAELKRRGSKVQLWILTADFTYTSPKWGVITAPEGMVTDFASVPTFAKRIIDGDSPMILFPSIIHDAIYHFAGRMPDGRIFTRVEADQILRDAMIDIGAPRHLAALVFSAVRVGGGFPWKRATRAKEQP